MDNHPDFQMIEIYKAIYAAFEQRVHLIGNKLVADSNKEAKKIGIGDGDFYNAIGYIVEDIPDGMILHLGSDIEYEQYVLGGKDPSWTPIKPLIAWVKRKGLTWSDKKTGKQLKVEQMAYMIRSKIRREGIPARNIFETVINNREEWIYQQLDSIEVKLAFELTL